ncbi:MAG: MFS transporter, partial [Candidatus Limnocylindria bacterium]
LPRIVLSPVGGWLADRYPKQNVVTVCSLWMVALGVVTALLYLGGQLTIGWLVVLGLLQGAAFAFLGPVRQAWIPQVVGTGHLLPNAVSLNNAGMNLTRVAGPAIAGLLISAPGFGLGGTFLLIAACWAWVTWATRQVHDPGAASAAAGRMVASIREGFSYVRRTPALLALMSLGFVPLAIGLPYINLMPAVADGPLRGGAVLLGILLGIGGVGSLFGTLLVASLSRYPHRATLQLVLGIGFGLAIVGFAFFVDRGQLVPAVPFLFLAGLSGDAYMAINSSLIMMSTEPGRYGRVMGIYMVAQSIRPISVMPIGALGDLIGVPTVLLGAGALVALFVTLVATLYPGYRRIDSAAAVETASPRGGHSSAYRRR